MASTQAKFAGWRFDFKVADWRFDFADSPGSNKGRTSRIRAGRGAEELVVTRDSDGLEIRNSDALLITDNENIDGPPVVVIVVNIEMGIDDYIVVQALYLLRLEEVQNPPVTSDPQEVFLTSVVDKIYLSDVLEKVTILNTTDFNKIVIDPSNQDTTFLCRKGYDTYYHKFTQDLDYREVRSGLLRDTQAQLEYLREFIVKSMYKERVAPAKAKGESKNIGSFTNEPAKHKLANESDGLAKSTPTSIKRQKLKQVVISIDDSDSESDDSSTSSSGKDLDLSDVDSEPLFSSDDEFRPKAKVAVEAKRKDQWFAARKKEKVKGPKSLTQITEDIEQPEEASRDVVNTLPCRENQFTEIYYLLEGSIDLASGTSVYISGVPGTGKTVTVREVIKQLYILAKKKDLRVFDYLEINGLKVLTPQHAYEALWNKLSTKKRVASNAVSTELESYFKDGKSQRPLVVLLDELDELVHHNQDFLYNVFNWATYRSSKLIVIAVANSMDLPEKTLSNKISSRLGLARIIFPSYTHDELMLIIKSKLELLQQQNVTIGSDSIEYACRKVANVSGDARRALRIVKRATELAKQSHFEDEKVTVTTKHIHRAISETTNYPVSDCIRNLTFVGKLILVGILSKKRKSGLTENSLGDVIDEIKQIVTLNSAKDSSQFVIEGKSILDVLYEDWIIRAKGFSFVLNELIEAGLVLKQNQKSERNSSIKLNVADEEITSSFKRTSSLRFFSQLIDQLE